MADGAAAELQHDVVAEEIEQLVHLARVDAAGRDGHHLAQVRPVLIEEQAALQVLPRHRIAAHVVEALHRHRIAFELADGRSGVQVIDAGETQPLRDHPERHAVVLLARVRAVPRAVHVQDHVVAPRPARHRLDRGPADDEVDHHDARAELLRELGALVHRFHRAGRHVEVVPLHLAAVRLRAVHRFHAEEEAIAPVHERLRVDVLVVLGEIEAAGQALVDDAAVVAAREPQLRLHRRAEQRTAELVEALALDHDARRRPLERLHVRHRDADVLEAQRLHRLEPEHVADQRCREVRDRPFLEQDQVVRDVREILLRVRRARPRVGHRIDAVRLGAIALARGQAVGPDHRPRRGRRLAGDGGGRFLGVHAFLRRDPEEADDVRVARRVVRLPVAHLAVLEDACGITLAGFEERVVGGCVHGEGSRDGWRWGTVRSRDRSGKVSSSDDLRK